MQALELAALLPSKQHNPAHTGAFEECPARALQESDCDVATRDASALTASEFRSSFLDAYRPVLVRDAFLECSEQVQWNTSVLMQTHGSVRVTPSEIPYGMWNISWTRVKHQVRCHVGPEFGLKHSRVRTLKTFLLEALVILT